MLPRTLWYYLIARRSYHYTKDELKRLQDKKLRRIIHHAYHNVPFYHRQFRSVGLTPSDIRGVDDMRLIPPLTKEDVHLNSSKIVASNKNPESAMVLRTSGTTGQPLKILWEREYRDLITAVNLRLFTNIGMKPWEKAAAIMYARPRDTSEGEKENKSSGFKFASKVYKLMFGSMSGHLPGLRVKNLVIGPDNKKEVAHALFDLKPTLIYSRPSYLRRIAYILRDEARPLHTKRVVVGSEVVSKGCISELMDLYQADVYQGYGSNEFGGLGCECTFRQGMHLCSDYFVFEILRGVEPASPGEAGEVFITNLHNKIMPLIRYRIGDIAVPYEDERCNCGSSLHRLGEIHGRLNDGLVSKEKERIPPGIIIDYLESVIGIRDFQLIQRDHQSITIRLKPHFNQANVGEALSAYLTSILGDSPTLEFEVTDDTVLEKYRPIISEI